MVVVAGHTLESACQKHLIIDVCTGDAELHKAALFYGIFLWDFMFLISAGQNN